jgi:hypothetical protein
MYVTLNQGPLIQAKKRGKKFKTLIAKFKIVNEN